MRMIKQLFTWTCALWLTSCATAPTAKQPPQNNPSETWGTRVQALSNVQSWNLKALVGIRNSSQASNNVSANLEWQQSHRNYSILLFGPMGSNMTQLTGGPGHVKLQTADGNSYTASSAESLLAQQTHWDLPVSNLYYWVRGLPVPNIAAQKQFDAAHHLTSMQQNGWQIQYLNYTSVNNVDVPSKIFLSNPPLSVKIAISQWTF